jgi:hypothetical protein
VRPGSSAVKAVRRPYRRRRVVSMTRTRKTSSRNMISRTRLKMLHGLIGATVLAGLG